VTLSVTAPGDTSVSDVTAKPFVFDELVCDAQTGRTLLDSHGMST